MKVRANNPSDVSTHYRSYLSPCHQLIILSNIFLKNKWRNHTFKQPCYLLVMFIASNSLPEEVHFISFISWCKCILFFTTMLPQYPVYRPIISTNLLVVSSPLFSSPLLFSHLFLLLSSLPHSFCMLMSLSLIT